jgi:hypothetical protein
MTALDANGSGSDIVMIDLVYKGRASEGVLGSKASSSVIDDTALERGLDRCEVYDAGEYKERESGGGS